MSDKKYQGPLMGWVNDPEQNKYDETAYTFKFRLKKAELEEILERYVTPLNEKGQGENVWFTLWKQKSGRYGLQVFDPNSESVKEYKAKKANEEKRKEAPAVTQGQDESDLPF